MVQKIADESVVTEAIEQVQRLPGRLIRGSTPLAGEFGSGVDDAKALALEVALRAA